MRRLVLFAIALGACGDDGAPVAPARPETVASMEATAASADDLVVARVDGRPVHASCVRGQATASGLDRRAALDECIAIELLAAAAAARGLDRDPDVAYATRQAMVSRLVDVEFTAKIRGPGDLPASMVETAVERRGPILMQPLRRTGVYARASLPKGTRAGTPEETAARALVEEIHRALAGRRDLFPADLFETAQRIAAARGATIDHDPKPYPTAIDSGGDPPWRKALFAVPAIGMITPPVRSAYGWEVILWVDTIPATNPTRQDLLATLFPDLRRAFFPYWTNRFAKAMQVARDPKWQETLSSLEEP